MVFVHHTCVARTLSSYTDIAAGCTTLFRLQSLKHPLLARFIETSKLQEFVDAEGRVFSVLKCSPHPNLPRVIACMDNITSPRAGKSEALSGSVLVFPNYHSDLHTLIRERSRLSEVQSRHYFKQLLGATAHLHARGVALRDIRLGKIMFSDGELQQLVIADLHGACFFPVGGRAVDCRNMSPAYVAPEVILNPYHESTRVDAVDMWSLGVILYVMLTGCYPFSSMNPASLCRKIVSCHYAAPSGASASVRRLLSRLLCPDPAHRLTARDVMEDPWVCGPGSEAGPLPAGPDSMDTAALECGGRASALDQVVPTVLFGVDTEPISVKPAAIGGVAPAPNSSLYAAPRIHTPSVTPVTAAASPASFVGAVSDVRACKRGQDSLFDDEPASLYGDDTSRSDAASPSGVAKRLCRATSWNSESTECEWD